MLVNVVGFLQSFLKVLKDTNLFLKDTDPDLFSEEPFL